MIYGPTFVGNLFVSPQPMDKAGDEIGGHTHFFDHTGFLVRGSVAVFVEGYDPKVLVAPTFVVIRKQTRHRIVALEDNTSWYCVFAIRDIDGNPQEVVSGNEDPWFVGIAGDYWDRHELTHQPSKADTIPLRSDTN